MHRKKMQPFPGHSRLLGGGHFFLSNIDKAAGRFGSLLANFQPLGLLFVQKRVVYIKKRCMWLFPECSHFPEGCHFFRHWEDSWHFTCASLVPFVAQKKKRCNHFWDTAISCIAWHFSFCNIKKAAGKILQSLLVILRSWFALSCKRKKKDATIFRTQPFPGGIPFFLFATLRRQLANYMGLYW